MEVTSLSNDNTLEVTPRPQHKQELKAIDEDVKIEQPVIEIF